MLDQRAARRFTPWLDGFRDEDDRLDLVAFPARQVGNAKLPVLLNHRTDSDAAHGKTPETAGPDR